MEEEQSEMQDRVDEEFQADEFDEWPNDLPEMELINHNIDPIGD